MPTVLASSLAKPPNRLSLLTRRYYKLPCTDLAPVLERAERGFVELLEDPLGSGFRINPDLCPKDELGEPYEIGLLEKKSGKKKEGDALGVFDKMAGRIHEDPSKQCFHYADILMDILPKALLLKYQDFLDACAMLSAVARSEAVELCSTLDSYNVLMNEPVYQGSLRERMGKAIVVTRLALYYPVAGSAPDAQQHADRSGITLHAYSSHPGLYLFDADKQPFAANETSTDEMLVFMGDKFQAITKGKCGRSMVHVVRDERRKEGTISHTDPRFTAVMFVHLTLTKDDLLWADQNHSVFRIEPSQYRLP